MPFDTMDHRHGNQIAEELIFIAAELRDNAKIFFDRFILGHFEFLRRVNLPENLCYQRVNETLTNRYKHYEMLKYMQPCKKNNITQPYNKDGISIYK